MPGLIRGRPQVHTNVAGEAKLLMAKKRREFRERRGREKATLEKIIKKKKSKEKEEKGGKAELRMTHRCQGKEERDGPFFVRSIERGGGRKEDKVKDREVGRQSGVKRKKKSDGGSSETDSLVA